MSLSGLPRVFADILNEATRLPGAISASLNPATEADARVVDSQLNFVQASIRKLNWALPIAGVSVLITASAYGVAVTPIVACFAALLAACLYNEWLFARRLPARPDGDIAAVAKAARTIA